MQAVLFIMLIFPGGNVKKQVFPMTSMKECQEVIKETKLVNSSLSRFSYLKTCAYKKLSTKARLARVGVE